MLIQYASHSEAFALLSIAPVNKMWQKVITEHDTIWRRLYLMKYPNQNPELKVKDWFKFFRQRAQAMKTVSDPHPIGNHGRILLYTFMN